MTLAMQLDGVRSGRMGEEFKAAASQTLGLKEAVSFTERWVMSGILVILMSGRIELAGVSTLIWAGSPRCRSALAGFPGSLTVGRRPPKPEHDSRLAAVGLLLL